MENKTTLIKNITGFEWDDDEPHHVDPNRLYGYAFTVIRDSLEVAEKWQCYAGSFSHVYGIYKGVRQLADMTLPNDYECHVIYQLKGPVIPKNGERQVDDFTPENLVCNVIVDWKTNEELQQFSFFHDGKRVMRSFVHEKLSTRFDPEDDEGNYFLLEPLHFRETFLKRQARLSSNSNC